MKVKEIEWKVEHLMDGEDTLRSWINPCAGRITVLNRLTGYGYRDIETGYKDPSGNFWLASGNFDIREYPDLTIQDAIDKIKGNANTSKPSEETTP